MAKQLKRFGLRKRRVFCLYPEEKDLIMGELAFRPRQQDRRHDRLCEMATIIPEIDIPDIRGRKPVAFNVDIPMVLDDAIRHKMEQTGQPYVRVLLAAAAAYRRRNPSQPAQPER